MKKKTFLAIIPARAGSKRLPNKNILLLNKKPLISYSIIEAKKSKYIDEVVVTSDGKDILKVAKQYKASIVKRPAKLSSDTATTFDAIKHTIKCYKKQNKEFDYIILLQPTSPLRLAKDIDNAIKILNKKNAKAVVSISRMEHSPLWSFKAKKNKKLDKIFKTKFMHKRSQDLPQYYGLNGAVYICKTKMLLKYGTFLLPKGIYGYKMPQKRSIDIDAKIDFQLAEILQKKG